MKLDTNSNAEETNEPEFVAELTPYRSLGRMGFILLMSFIAVTCFMSGLLFLVVGAWPVFVFMGLDVLVIFLAFKINYRAARAKERVTVSRDNLKIEKIDARGRIQEHLFNPFWTRFEVDRHDEFGIMKMWVRSKDQQLSIGSFLNPQDRESFAFAFNSALMRARS